MRLPISRRTLLFDVVSSNPGLGANPGLDGLNKRSFDLAKGLGHSLFRSHLDQLFQGLQRREYRRNGHPGSTDSVASIVTVAIVVGISLIGLPASSTNHPRLARFGRMKMRLLGDQVLRRRAWTIAEKMGWDSTYVAEYVALTQLQADVFVTMDRDLARSVEGIVEMASVDALQQARSVSGL